jgi:hypothetical protein
MSYTVAGRRQPQPFQSSRLSNFERPIKVIFVDDSIESHSIHRDLNYTDAWSRRSFAYESFFLHFRRVQVARYTYRRETAD